MGGICRKSERPQKNHKKDDDKAKKSPPPHSTEDDDIEDGDMATPKQDREGDDDQPL